MSFTEMLTEVEKLTAEERRELMRTLREAEREDIRAAYNNGEKPKSFAEAAAHLIGSVDSGITDLGSNKKHLEGLGRDEKRNR